VNAHPRPYYYLENFNVALDWLRERYRELLADEERRFMADFARLPTESAALVVRMIMRQGDLFRTSKLNYGEIGCPRTAAAPLVDLGWLDPRPLVSFPSLWRILRKAEICSAFGLEGAAVRKAELLPLLGETTTESRALDEWWPQAPDILFQVKIATLCERLRLMFFGNFHQTWSEFVLADLGIFRYEKVNLNDAARAFRTRDQIEQFHAIYRCRELLDTEAPLEEILAAVPAPLPGAADTWIEVKRAKLLFHIAQCHEKALDLPRALALYRDCAHPEARIRSVRVLEKLDRPHEAATLLAEAQQNPTSELEAQLAARILPRLNRKLNGGALRRHARANWTTLELQLPYPDPPQRVEMVVSGHLSTPEAPVVYVENTLLNSLFGLLCWDAIFAPLPGAFFHPFHAAPADLLEPQFQQRRAAEFASCLERLENDSYRDAILDTFETKSGIQSAFVFWGSLTRPLLERALDCIPARHLRLVFARLLADIRNNRSGLPDLIQLGHRYRLIEVKGPGDRLQDNQLRWLGYCQANGIPVCVCKVTWQTEAA
jgi:VRR-NUC domain